MPTVGMTIFRGAHSFFPLTSELRTADSFRQGRNLRSSRLGGLGMTRIRLARMGRGVRPLAEGTHEKETRAALAACSGECSTTVGRDRGLFRAERAGVAGGARGLLLFAPEDAAGREEGAADFHRPSGPRPVLEQDRGANRRAAAGGEEGAANSETGAQRPPSGSENATRNSRVREHGTSRAERVPPGELRAVEGGPTSYFPAGRASLLLLPAAPGNENPRAGPCGAASARRPGQLPERGGVLPGLQLHEKGFDGGGFPPAAAPARPVEPEGVLPTPGRAARSQTRKAKAQHREKRAFSGLTQGVCCAGA